MLVSQQVVCLRLYAFIHVILKFPGLPAFDLEHLHQVSIHFEVMTGVQSGATGA